MKKKDAAVLMNNFLETNADGATEGEKVLPENVVEVPAIHSDKIGMYVARIGGGRLVKLEVRPAGNYWLEVMW